MKKYGMILALAAGVLLAASCGKTIEVPQQTGFTLTATIANSGPETKTTYTDPNDGTLTVGWEDGEKLSLLICDPTDGIVKNYVLDGTKVDDKNCTFRTSGTIDALTGSQYYLCVYPALVNDTGSQYESETKTLVYGVESKELVYEGSGYTHFSQNGAANPDHLKNGDLLVGSPVISGSEAQVSLERKIGVLKVIVKLPPSFAGKKAFVNGGFGDMTETYSGFVGALTADWNSGTFVSGKGSSGVLISFKSAVVVPASCQVVLYLPVGPCTIDAGSYSFVFMTGAESGLMFDAINTTTAVKIEANKMTTLSVDLSSTGYMES